MARLRIYFLPVAILLASTTLAVNAATETERIVALEQQLNQQKLVMQQQQRLLESMATELQRLKAGQPRATIQTTEVIATQQPPAPPRVATPDTKPPGKMSASIYGYVQTDAIYDFKRVAPDWEDTLRATTISTTSGAYGQDGKSLFSVRSSLIGIQGGYGEDITYKLEWDLFGEGSEQGETVLHLRNAWATYKNFGMGEIASNFMDPDVVPDLLDYWGPTGLIAYRNQQARYTVPLGDNEFSISIENPNTALTVGEGRSVQNCGVPNPSPQCLSVESRGEQLFMPYNDVPDFGVRYRQNGSFGHFQVAGLARKLGYQRKSDDSKGYEVGWGVNTSAVINTGGSDNLKVQLVYGEGIGDYINDGGIDIAPDASGSAQAVPLAGLSAYYEHYWNTRWSTTLGWSMTDLDTSSGQMDTEFKRGQIAQINLLHYPADHVLLGTEFLWGEREDVGGNTGSDYRVLFSLRVNFDTGDLLR